VAPALETATCMVHVEALFDKRTSSVQYVVADEATNHCAIIDPVLDFNESSASIRTSSADRLLGLVRARGYKLQWVLDTHPHADHLSAAGYLKDQTGAPIAIGEKVTAVQRVWKQIYGLPDSFPTDGRQWDRLLVDGERIELGRSSIEVILSPGHTVASITYVIDGAAFIHDTLFMPDVGTARADFPGGSAADLWESIQRILALPGSTRLFTGHDYAPKDRKPAWESTIARQRAENVHLRKAPTVEEFVKLRAERDKELPLPAQMLFALQINIRGGRLPEPIAGKRNLTIPVDAFPDAAWK
jgi:glyoxylase-like metal-dependent hydrolase (beta-lactamase superfamily II)